jgi:hypothetical protein
MTIWCDTQLYAKELTAERLRRAEHARLLGEARHASSGGRPRVRATRTSRALVLWAAVWHLLTHGFARLSLSGA